jgi:hypothetical protein
MSTTAGDQINRALRLLGVLAEGETPSANTSADALLALDQMLDSWSTERLSVFATIDQTFTWPSGQVLRTLGPTGDFVGVRPVALDDATYYIAGGISYPIELINDEQYDSIVLKTANSTLPSVLYVNADIPNASMYLYPVPSQALEFHFISVETLTQTSSLSTVLSFPPGYLRAIAYKLALELAPEFGVDVPVAVVKIAAESKRAIRRINNPEDVMSVPSVLLSSRGYFNIYSGRG